jgi:hypothetical protein
LGGVANEVSQDRGPFQTAKRWFGSFVSILDALDVVWLAALLLLFSGAILASPYILARDFLQGALVVPAVIVIAASFACVAALAIAWAHRGLRWWYFLLLIAASGAITEFGRAYLER